MKNLNEYQQKRQFDRTPEPSGSIAKQKQSKQTDGRTYVIQKHAASRLHYDFRLELNGVLKSWAVPKGPSYDPAEKSLAVHVEDHPLEYARFEGVIPQGQYGGGTVMLWDQGTWQPVGDPEKGYRTGKLKFHLHGEKLRGTWQLVRMKEKSGEEANNWLLIKKADRHAQSVEEYDVREAEPYSIHGGRTMQQIAREHDQGNGRDGTSSESLAGSGSPLGSSSLPSDPGRLPGARKRSMPAELKPQLATAVKSPPRGDQWLHEIKFDGYRLLAHLDGQRVTLRTRHGNDWTHRFQAVAQSVAELPLRQSILDGELVVLLPDGTTDFQALQNTMRRDADHRLVYYAFDLPYYEGYDLSKTPLSKRKDVLRQLIESTQQDVVRYSDHIRGKGGRILGHACQHALEGLVSKRADSPYVNRRSRDWLKSKCLKRQEFVVGGWSDPGGSRKAFGSLLLGVYEHEKLLYCGRVGTGFNSQSLVEIKAELDQLGVRRPPFENPPRGAEAKDVHWVEPQLVAEVEFSEWTSDGMLRHPSFQGLREDKLPREVKKEIERSSVSRKTAHQEQTEIAGVSLSNPRRILYPEQGTTKQELAEYYQKVADWILPHVAGRPLTLVRCPQGHRSKCFYQKHLNETMPDTLRGVEIKEKDQRRRYVVLDDLAGLISLVQLSVLEFHPWPAREDRLERPDRLVFDLDPGPGIHWQAMIDAARDVREELLSDGLQCFVRTSGGKGLHVVAPVERRTSWEDHKSFARHVAKRLVERFPDRYVATVSKEKRKGRIFVDYLRNGRGATAVACYSTRARNLAPVCTPLRWDELGRKRSSDQYNIRNLPRRLGSLKGDPWKGFFDLRQSIRRSALGKG